jgi:hypothetical protein
VILVLASRFDAEAASVTERLAGRGVRLVTCRDLSRSGWRLRPGDPRSATASVGEQEVTAGEIDGVVLRLPYVDPAELGHIREVDRDYVAAEMHAFLVAWLFALRERTLNVASPGNLGGPAWPRPRWLRLASGLGIAVAAAEVRDPAIVSVVAGRAVGGGSLDLARAAEQMARQAGTGLLRVIFDRSSSEARLAGADCWPDLASAPVVEALLDRFGSRVLC